MTEFIGQDLVCIRGERTVFSGLAFDLADGGALVLRGANGSGKSSLLRLMSGLLPPAAGRLAWDGRSIGEDPEAHRAALHYVGHADPVKPMLTVAENVAFWTGLRSGEAKAAEVDQAAARGLAAFGVSHLAEVPARFLSAGQKRRVNLARLVSSAARLWLLDEPATALDSDAVIALERAMDQHRASGGMVVVSTHAHMALDDARIMDMGNYVGGGR